MTVQRDNRGGCVYIQWKDNIHPYNKNTQTPADPSQAKSTRQFLLGMNALNT